MRRKSLERKSDGKPESGRSVNEGKRKKLEKPTTEVGKAIGNNSETIEGSIKEGLNELNKMQLSQTHQKVFQSFLNNFNELVQIYRDEEYTMIQQGIHLLSVHNYKTAMECFENVLEINPDNSEAKSLYESCKAMGVLEIQKQLITSENNEIFSLFDELMLKTQSKNSQGDLVTGTQETKPDIGNKEKQIKPETQIEESKETLTNSIEHKTNSYQIPASEKFAVPNSRIFVKANSVLIDLIEKLNHELDDVDSLNEEDRSFYIDEIDMLSKIDQNKLKKIGLKDQTIKIIIDSKKNADIMRSRIFQSSNKLLGLLYNIKRSTGNSSSGIDKLPKVSMDDLNWMKSEQQEIIKILRSGKINKNVNPKTLECVRIFLKVIKSIVIYCDTFREIANAQSHPNDRSTSKALNKSYYYPVFDLYNELKIEHEKLNKNS